MVLDLFMQLGHEANNVVCLKSRWKPIKRDFFLFEN